MSISDNQIVPNSTIDLISRAIAFYRASADFADVLSRSTLEEDETEPYDEKIADLQCLSLRLIREGKL